MLQSDPRDELAKSLVGMFDVSIAANATIPTWDNFWNDIYEADEYGSVSDFAVQYTPNRNQVTPAPSDPDYHAKVRELYPSLEAYRDSIWDTLDAGPDELFVSGHLVSNPPEEFYREHDGH